MKPQNAFRQRWHHATGNASFIHIRARARKFERRMGWKRPRNKGKRPAWLGD